MEPACGFIENLEYANDILTLPQQINEIALTTLIRHPIVDQLMNEFEKKGMDITDTAVNKELLEEIDRRVQELKEQPESRNEVELINQTLFFHMLLDGKTKRATQRAFGSALSFVWTSFEGLCRDRWISIVNGRPKKYGIGVIKAKGEQPDGLSSKSIEIGAPNKL